MGQWVFEISRERGASMNQRSNRVAVAALVVLAGIHTNGCVQANDFGFDDEAPQGLLAGGDEQTADGEDGERGITAARSLPSSGRAVEATRPAKIKTESLTPEAGSDVLELLTVTTFADGSKIVEGAITERSDGALKVSYAVDTSKNTYVAKIVPADERSGGVVPGVAIGTRSVEVAVVTYDPVLLEVARHFSKLTWTAGFSSGVNVVTGFSSQHSCPAQNPTMILNTHWFTSQCDKADVLSSAKTQVSTAVTARFWNTDFHDPNLRTDVTSWSRITGTVELGYSVNFWHAKSGENSSLLTGELFIKPY